MARHLVAAGELLDEDPAAALLQARAARSLAGRVAAVREANGLAAYHAGEYAEALAELRAARRIDGSPRHLAVMADSERGLGRPDRALALVAEPAAAHLDQATRAELKIVEAGARRDLGQGAAAVLALRGPELDITKPQPWSVRLWYAYADALAGVGRNDEARTWFAATAELDEDEETDASERVLALRR